MTHNQLEIFLHRRLHVVALDDAIPALHDSRLRISEVISIFIAGPRLLLRLALWFCLAVGPFLQFLLGLADSFQARFFSLQLFRKLISPLASSVEFIFPGVDRIGSVKPLLHLFLDPLLLLLHPPAAHSFMLGGMGFHLAAVQRRSGQLLTSDDFRYNRFESKWAQSSFGEL